MPGLSVIYTNRLIVDTHTFEKGLLCLFIFYSDVCRSSPDFDKDRTDETARCISLHYETSVQENSECELTLLFPTGGV